MSSLKNKLKHYIYQRGRVSYDELARLAMDSGQKVDTMSRRMREVVEEGKIAPILSKKGAVVGYEVIRAKHALNEQINTNKKLSWRERLKEKREKEKIRKMRDENGRIILFSN